MSYRLPNADGIVFDFNGTLFLDERENRESWNMIAIELRGYALSEEEFLRENGRRDDDMVRAILPGVSDDEAERWGCRKEEIYKDLCISRSLDLAPGARQLFEKALSRGMRIAIASSAPKMNMDWYITRFRLLDYFQPSAIIAGRTDIPSKPDGAIFRLALESIGVEGGRAIAFEDSRAGVLSAKDAGISTIYRMRCPGSASLEDPDIIEIGSIEEIIL